MLWDCQWQVVLIPTICLVAATGEHMFLFSDIPGLSVPVMKAMQLLSGIRGVNDTREGISFVVETDWALIYVVLIITTTLMCTLLIVYRITCFVHRLLLF